MAKARFRFSTEMGFLLACRPPNSATTSRMYLSCAICLWRYNSRANSTRSNPSSFYMIQQIHNFSRGSLLKPILLTRLYPTSWNSLSKLISLIFILSLSCFLTTSVKFLMSTSLFKGNVALAIFSNSSIVIVCNRVVFK